VIADETGESLRQPQRRQSSFEITILVPTIAFTMRLPSVRRWSSSLPRTLGSPQIAS
jgi:hypothetical protein